MLAVEELCDLINILKVIPLRGELIKRGKSRSSKASGRLLFVQSKDAEAGTRENNRGWRCSKISFL